MNQQKTVESRVLSILKDCPRARFDDMILIMHYYNRYATYLRAGELPLNDLAFNYKTLKPRTAKSSAAELPPAITMPSLSGIRSSRKYRCPLNGSG